MPSDTSSRGRNGRGSPSYALFRWCSGNPFESPLGVTQRVSTDETDGRA